MTIARWLGLSIGLSLALPARGENVLWIVLDDVGVDRIGAYGEHPDPGRTPNIDALAEQGVLFRNAWSNPNCSPTRATLLTGCYAFRTGIGDLVPLTGGFGGLRLEETTLPEALAPGVHSAALGKWHLATNEDGLLHPNESGFASFAGSFRNVNTSDGGVDFRSAGAFDYFRWRKTVDGVTAISELYATTDTIDDAVAAVGNLPEPWFLYVALNAAHTPLHAPPDHLHGFDLSGPPPETPVAHMKAMTQALDSELGRLVSSLDLTDTTVMLVGDNGTARIAIDAPFVPAHGKGSLYEGGINVPLVIAGAGVDSRGECAALVNTTDLFATACELLGAAAPTATDSVSLAPYLRDPQRPSLRSFVYAERFSPNGFGPHAKYVQAVRGRRYKLIWDRVARKGELYDLLSDPFEHRDLLEVRLGERERFAFERLKQALVRFAGS